MIVSDNTRAAEDLGDFFKNLDKKAQCIDKDGKCFKKSRKSFEDRC